MGGHQRLQDAFRLVVPLLGWDDLGGYPLSGGLTLKPGDQPAIGFEGLTFWPRLRCNPGRGGGVMCKVEGERPPAPATRVAIELDESGQWKQAKFC